MYIQLESIVKEQKSQRNFNKWNNYNIINNQIQVNQNENNMENNQNENDEQIEGNDEEMN